MKKAKFTIGPFQTFQQAWSAMLKGHFARRRDWPEGIAYMLSDTESVFGKVVFQLVNLNANPPTATEHTDNITAMDILCNDWEILKQAWK